jgi:hypothetical protein
MATSVRQRGGGGRGSPRPGSAADGDPARLVLLRARQAQAQHAVLQLRRDPLRVDPVGQLQAAGERTGAALAAVVGLRPLRRRAAGPAQGQRVLVRLDLELVLLDPGQLGHDRDAVRPGVDVDRREAGGGGHGPAGGGREGARQAVHLVLEPAQLAGGVGAPEEAEGVPGGGHRVSLPVDRGRRPRLAGRRGRPSG